MKTGSLKKSKIPMEVVLGRKELALEDLAKLGEGTVLELDSMAGEPVYLLAAGEPIARGEVVVIDENFGIRITRMLYQENGK